MRIGFTLNGRQVTVECDASGMALGLLRDEFGLTSVRGTCGIGLCGSCTILVDGRTTSSCILPAPLLQDREVMTIEGISADDLVIAAFESVGAFQCGFCIPAMVLTARRLLEETPDPTEDQIALALAGNICRCGSYLKIRDAVRTAAAAMRGERAG